MKPFDLTGNKAAVRGDTIRLLVTVVRNDLPLNINGATFKFIAKRWINDDIPMIYKDNTAFTLVSPSEGTTYVTIPPEDTENFTDTVLLNCNVEMVESDDLKTTVARGVLEVKMDVLES